MILLVKLLLAHLIGDFLLQPSKWVAHKETYKFKSIYLYVHLFIHIALTAFAFGNWEDLGWAIGIGFIHSGIDLTKLIFQNDGNRRQWFVTDQLLHLLTLILICAYKNEELYLNNPSDSFWIVFTAAIFLTKPTSILIKTLISAWIPQPITESNSLENAGNYIGMMERLLILCFILTGHFEAVGFLLGAKSIFRFGDLTAKSDRRLTEYVLIGTLLSFGIAILTALGAEQGLLLSF